MLIIKYYIWVKKMKRKNYLFPLFALVILLVVLLVFSLSFVKINLITNVTEVIDGDTFDILEKRIRLADMDTPEYNNIGYEEAKDFLKTLIEKKLVYLDIDDYGSTTYGRIVCVVYFRFNSTHLLNVNKELLNMGYAEIWDHTNNEFNPYVWTEFIYYPNNIENILLLITNDRFRLLLEGLIITVIITIIMLVLHVHKKVKIVV
jgi:hypothetical protein